MSLCLYACMIKSTYYGYTIRSVYVLCVYLQVSDLVGWGERWGGELMYVHMMVKDGGERGYRKRKMDIYQWHQLGPCQ